MAAPETRSRVRWSDTPQIRAEFIGRRLALYVAVAGLGLALGVALAHVPLLIVGGALASLAFVALIVVKPFIGVLLYIVIFFVRIGEMYPALARFRLELLVGALTLICLFIDQIRRERHIMLDGSRQTKLLLALFVAMLLSVPMAYWRKAAVDGCIEFARIIGFYIMIVHLVDTRTRLRIVVTVFCLCTLWVVGPPLYDYFTGNLVHVQGIDRATGTTSVAGNYNALGATIASAFPLFFLLATRRSRGSVRVMAALSSMTLLVGLIVTGSRSALLGFLAAMACLWWQSKRRALLGVVGLSLVVAGFTLIPDQYKERYKTIAVAVTSGELDGSSKSRVDIWMTSLRMVAARPLFGIGMDCFGSVNGDITGSWMNAHNLYFQVLAELGLVGFLVFVAFLGSMLGLNRSAKRAVSELGDEYSFEETLMQALFAGLVALLVTGVFGASLVRRTWYLYAALDLVVLRLFLRQTLRPGADEPRSESG